MIKWSKTWAQWILRPRTIMCNSNSKIEAGKLMIKLIILFSIAQLMVTSSLKTLNMEETKRITGKASKKWTKIFSLRWTLPSSKSMEKTHWKETLRLKWNRLETLSTTKPELLNLSTMLSRRKVSKQIHQSALSSQLRPLNGKSLIHTCKSTKREKDLLLKKQLKIKKEKISQHKLSNNMLKIHSILILWRELSKSWKEWLSKTLTTKSLKTTNIMKIIQKIEKLETMVQYFHCGDSQHQNLKRSMSLQ